MIRMVAKLLKVLNSEADPSQISLAFSLSMVSGFLPYFSPLNLLVLLVVFLVRVNFAAYFLGTAFFSGIAYLLDPLFNQVGLALLTAAPLEGFWTALYNTTLGRLQKFNNSVVMGSFITALFLFVPLVFITNAAIRRYREHVLQWVMKTRFMKMITASKLYDIYSKVSGWGWGGQS